MVELCRLVADSLGVFEHAPTAGARMSTSTDDLRARNLRTVLALAALFFLPLLASFVLYYGTDWRPTSSSAHGELMEPPRPLPAVQLGEIGTPQSTLRPVFGDKW